MILPLYIAWVCYMLLAAVSHRTTLVPDTAGEFRRLGALVVCALAVAAIERVARGRLYTPPPGARKRHPKR